MNINLGHSLHFELALRFAELIHAQVVRQHLSLINPRAYGKPGDRDTLFRQVRDAVSSVGDRWERRELISNIRYHFINLRERRGTEVRGRDYVAKVRAFEAQEGGRA